MLIDAIVSGVEINGSFLYFLDLFMYLLFLLLVRIINS